MIEEIEREVMTEMAGALGKTSDKCNYMFMLLEQQGHVCDGLVGKGESASAAAAKFNALRKDAEEARRDLIIQRQAVGFETGNFKTVYQLWPLPPTRLSTGGPSITGVQHELPRELREPALKDSNSRDGWMAGSSAPYPRTTPTAEPTPQDYFDRGFKPFNPTNPNHPNHPNNIDKR
jgi:hypothetical protein